ncbi:helix-turn-helix domain-containing protein [Streptomyces sp. NPDC056500]|uniref:helix-turn-helix domain-containing protein n=1 Tax=Streptomyces sp. NPDC056500 TaxID=3345840 RepID=UPI0036AF4BF1
MTDTTAHPVQESPATTLGTRLRAVRLDSGESVRGLARRIGCSASLLSQIELGKTAPSVGILYRLANELNVSTDFLLRPEPSPSREGSTTEQATSGAATAPGAAPTGGFRSLQLLPPSYQAQIQRADSRRGIDFGNGVRWERLTTISDSQVDFLEIVYEPGGSSNEDDHSGGHEGFEYGIVTAGELTIRTGDEEYVLRQGDSIAFDSLTPHVFRNAGTTTARAIWFVVHGTRTS